jgi:transcriptional regulator with XRE-family HTH domain
MVGLSYIQIGRFEKGKLNPSSDVLQKLAVALDTTTDYLMNGGTEQVNAQLSDKDLLRHFKEVELLPEKDKILCKKLFAVPSLSIDFVSLDFWPTKTIQLLRN